MATLTFVPTHVPRLYDPSLATFKPALSYDGAKVRIKVKIPEGTADYWQLLERARLIAEKKYLGATIYAVPEFEEASDKPELSEGIETDEKLVEQYVSAHVPQKLRHSKQRIVAYVVHCLSAAAPALRGVVRPHVKFESVEAENFLSFEKVSYQFKPGVTLITGKNLDWGGGANGAGKTNFLQLARAALYGSTTKGQAHDALAHRRFKERISRVSVRFKRGVSGTSVERQRNPMAIRLLVDGKEQSSGHRKTKQEGTTESLIIGYVGMTEEMFDHSVLIDQKLVNTAATFLSGTDKEKKSLLDAFLGTERFLKAQESVREDLRRCEYELDDLEARAQQTTSEREQLESEIYELHHDTYALDLKKKLGEQKYKLRKLESVSDETEIREQRRKHELKVAKATTEKEYCHQVWLEAKADVERYTKALGEVEVLQSKCPTCGQRVSETTKRALVHSLKSYVGAHQCRVDALYKVFEKASENVRTLFDKSGELLKRSQTIKAAKQECVYVRNAIRQTLEMLRTAPMTKLLHKSEKKLRRVKQKLGYFKAAKESLRARIDRMTFAEKVLGRDGLVNYLYSQLCVKLNRAAEFYSETLADSVIGLRFVPYTKRKSGEVVNEFDVRIINSQGGETRKDQSRGEEQLASIICLLALREIGPQCNLLILDEPAEGLEPRVAARFAEGLEQLTNRFETILLATHNEHLKAKFASEQAVVIVKRNKVSRLEVA